MLIGTSRLISLILLYLVRLQGILSSLRWISTFDELLFKGMFCLSLEVVELDFRILVSGSVKSGIVDILNSLSDSLRISSARLTLSVMSVFLPMQELSEARRSNDWNSWESLLASVSNIVSFGGVFEIS